MNRKEDKKTKILLILCILLSIGFISTAFAYIRTSTAAVTNTFIAAGAEVLFDFDEDDTDINNYFKLYEHKAIMNEDGTYTLGNEEVDGNDYKVIPGIDILKDPTILIKNKTSIPAYLYLEVVGDCSAYFNYDIDSNWEKLEGVTGNNTGNIYVYKYSTDSYQINAINGEEKFNIIDNKTLYTKDEITETNKLSLNFYAYLAQVVENKTPAEIYTLSFPKLS